MNIVLGITGSIAAYKALELIRSLIKVDADVRVILTKSALQFITPLSCQTLSKNEVYIDQFILTRGIKHLSLAEWADLFVVAPATANIIGKAASGIGDDLLSTTLLSFPKPILYVPAMDSNMWDNSIVQRNVRLLRKVGHHFLEPVHGVLASGKVGKGRFPDTYYIIRKIMSVQENYQSLDGSRIVITGGRTEEDIDPVRVITNRSTGRMARELIYAALCRDAQVKAIIGESSVDFPDDIDESRVRTCKEMLKKVKQHITWCDCLIMCAAIGDYRPATRRKQKVHDKDLNLKLTKNVDILKTLSSQKKGKCFIGFSLEGGKQTNRARKKLSDKQLDFIVSNRVSAIGSDVLNARIIPSQGRQVRFSNVTKWQLANNLLDLYSNKFLKNTEHN